MKKNLGSLTVFCLILTLFIGIAVSADRMVTVMSQQEPLPDRKCVIIDAGHGGVDGGATSCTGVLESQINLQIALRLNDLMHLLGIQTQMIRTDDRSVYTEGETIAAKKVSDLKQRVRIVNGAENAVLVSIHQNHFSDDRYHGAQVFYAAAPGSAELAKAMQSSLVTALNPGSKRGIKKADSIYLLEKINCTGILIECGFLSNHEEEAKLRGTRYQQQLCCVIAAVCSRYLYGSAA